ncbi:hypothetical protein GCM10009641_46960 [Mycobacterium cookii]|uniref:Uncharacterized protein n=1 Tax=Nocardioides furvisabuli TaxID=375542 RepID=A0ABP5JEB3_9ACTN
MVRTFSRPRSETEPGGNPSRTFSLAFAREIDEADEQLVTLLDTRRGWSPTAKTHWSGRSQT